MKIFKYEIPIIDMVEIELPQGAEVLTVNMQHGKLCLWAKVDPAAPVEKRRFYIHGTGHEMRPLADRYINTFYINGGVLVFHVFEALRS